VRRSGPLARWISAFERRPFGWSPRGLLLYLLPLPLLPALAVSLLRGDFARIVGDLAALGACWGAAVLTRAGLRAEALYRHRRIARRPPPRRLAAAALLGAGVAVGAHLAVGHDWPLAALLGAGSVAGFALAYGIDPLRAKRVPAGLGIPSEDVLRTLEEADARIARIEATSRRIGDVDLSARLGRIAQAARSVVDLLEEDPRDLRRARRFLQVYLSGTEQVTERYARKRSAPAAAELDGRFRSVLQTVEQVFEDQRRHLLEDDTLDLDVQIEVLSRQLALEAKR
jgi:5-bromo-4-chloroindolyl phosphate hydrolysis protein